MKHFGILDGIRGLAIIFVMVYHFSIPFQLDKTLMPLDRFVGTILQMGWIGVDLFFVMSGFLITAILYDSADKPNYFKNFYARRLLRIFPLYYAVLFAMIIVLPRVLPSMAEKTAIMQDNAFWFWSYLVNWRVAWLGDFNHFQSGYMWSLAVEEQFYMIWPMIVLYFRHKLIPLCMITIALSALLRIYLLWSGASPTTVYVMTITHVDGLLIGAILAVCYKEGRLDDGAKRLIGIAGIVGLCLFFVVIIATGKFVFYTHAVGYAGILGISLLSGYFLVKAFWSNEDSWLHRFLSSPLLVEPGKLCYGLYLLHQPIGVVITEKLISHKSFVIFNSSIPAALANIAVCMTVSYIVALASFHFYEKHFLKLKRYFA